MTAKEDPDAAGAGQSWLQAELQDSFDEELEMEFDDTRYPPEVRALVGACRPSGISRSVYFRELMKLQSELIKLQDWVIAKKLKVVVLFEGRDAAGKGGVIKRLSQRLDPRRCRVVALPAPTEREQTQWYFQRYIPHLPGG